jgi:hypothetical protein
MNERIPSIRVPVLYPLGFVPGESANWIETVNDCFRQAMMSLHERVMEAGYEPAQGVVTGPHEEVEGVVVPKALGFLVNEGENPKSLTTPEEVAAEIGDDPVSGAKAYRQVWGYGVFMPDDEGELQPCVTEEKKTFLVYQGGVEAWEKASQKDGAVVVKVMLLWDAENEAHRKKSGRS